MLDCVNLCYDPQNCCLFSDKTTNETWGSEVNRLAGWVVPSLCMEPICVSLPPLSRVSFLRAIILFLLLNPPFQGNFEPCPVIYTQFCTQPLETSCQLLRYVSPNFFVVWIALFACFFSHKPLFLPSFRAYCPMSVQIMRFRSGALFALARIKAIILLSPWLDACTFHIPIRKFCNLFLVWFALASMSFSVTQPHSVKKIFFYDYDPNQPRNLHS